VEKAAQRLLYEKVTCKMLIKLTPVVNFINVLRAAFSQIFLHQKITKLKHKWKKAAQRLLYEKGTCKMLMKLTPGRKKGQSRT